MYINRDFQIESDKSSKLNEYVSWTLTKAPWRRELVSSLLKRWINNYLACRLWSRRSRHFERATRRFHFSTLHHCHQPRDHRSCYLGCCRRYQYRRECDDRTMMMTMDLLRRQQTMSSLQHEMIRTGAWRVVLGASCIRWRSHHTLNYRKEVQQSAADGERGEKVVTSSMLRKPCWRRATAIRRYLVDLVLQLPCNVMILFVTI